MFREKEEPTLFDYLCPLTGEKLYNYGSDMHTMDGPCTIKTENGKQVYEKWPRDWGVTLYPANTTRRGFLWIPSLNEEYWDRAAWNFNPLWKDIPEWKEFVEVAGKHLFLDDPFFDDRKKRVEIAYEADKHLRQLEYDRKVASGEITPGPFMKRVVFQTTKIEDVKICPLPAPNGLLFYMDYKINETPEQIEVVKPKFEWLTRILFFISNIWPFG